MSILSSSKADGKQWKQKNYMNTHIKPLTTSEFKRKNEILDISCFCRKQISYVVLFNANSRLLECFQQGIRNKTQELYLFVWIMLLFWRDWIWRYVPVYFQILRNLFDIWKAEQSKCSICVKSLLKLYWIQSLLVVANNLDLMSKDM